MTAPVQAMFSLLADHEHPSLVVSLEMLQHKKLGINPIVRERKIVICFIDFHTKKLSGKKEHYNVEFNTKN